ncbi:hypothetical protein BO82DRAFT_88225 [Aspergillus uvarum CBS 121591]|uniref:Uncharacterized protein n=1 Tax=Aspergillus uvarum CBS 121591 TaxID=1448315 RepID=A0A319CMW1_9EURO|nr:hypothetical protein BO82DRAFT_88225 [Aspergillus uvarum CBS 121591]PYH86524.1 hypothetical protein BO82DRAFT_88225 [Aspergillus uvarum CBS 121591]
MPFRSRFYASTFAPSTIPCSVFGHPRSPLFLCLLLRFKRDSVRELRLLSSSACPPDYMCGVIFAFLSLSPVGCTAYSCLPLCRVSLIPNITIPPIKESNTHR